MEIGKAEGFGVFNWSNGEKFVGEHIDGKANGYGIIFDADGYKYVGEFKDKKEKDWIIYYTEWIKIYWSMEKWERNWAWNKTLL